MAELTSLYRTPVTETFPDTVTVTMGEQTHRYRKVSWSTDDGPIGLRYGENPHQPAAYYVPERPISKAAIEWMQLGKGGPSWINLADVDHALRLLRYFDPPAVAVMKHLTPAGVATQRGIETLAELVELARACDARAAFGGVVVTNRPITAETATVILSGFVEVVAAPGFTDGALAILGTKADLRVGRIALTACQASVGPDRADVDIKVLSDGSMLLQTPYATRIRSVGDLLLQPAATRQGTTVTIDRVPGADELQDLLFAWHVTTCVRSNGIVLARGGRTLAVGTGEQERVGAVEQAIAKAHQKGHDLRGAVVGSDAFFPFRDAIDALAQAGVTAVIQPGGSLRDDEVIAACNAHGMAMVFTGERCFGHF